MKNTYQVRVIGRNREWFVGTYRTRAQAANAADLAEALGQEANECLAKIEDEIEQEGIGKNRQATVLQKIADLKTRVQGYAELLSTPMTALVARLTAAHAKVQATATRGSMIEAN